MEVQHCNYIYIFYLTTTLSCLMVVKWVPNHYSQLNSNQSEIKWNEIDIKSFLVKLTSCCLLPGRSDCLCILHDGYWHNHMLFDTSHLSQGKRRLHMRLDRTSPQLQLGASTGHPCLVIVTALRVMLCDAVSYIHFREWNWWGSIWHSIQWYINEWAKGEFHDY